MLIGVHEQYQGESATTPSATLERYPNAMITREFKSGVIKPQNLVPAMTNLANDIWQAGLVANVSFKLSPADVKSGAWKIYVQQLCRVLVDNGRTGKTVLTWWHEPEDDARDSYPNGTNKNPAFESATDFVNYFNTIHGWCKEVSGNVVTSHAALGYGYRPNVGGPNDKSAWVGNPGAWVTDADIQAIDIYNGRSFPLNVALPDMPAFKRWFGSRPGNKGWGVAERGWTADAADSATRAATIDVELAWLGTLPTDVTPRPVFYIAWLTEGVEGDDGLKPDAAMVDAINNGYANIVKPAPEPTPEPSPSTNIECPLCHGSGTVPPGNYVINTTVTVTR